MQQESQGRVSQKARTRTDLLEAAITLIRQGKRPTVEEAALAAGISKRTAYRYFVSQDHLLADAALEALRPVMSVLVEQAVGSGDAQARVSALAVAMNRLALTHEAELRVMIRASLDAPAAGATDQRTRGQRRMDWITLALAPVRSQLGDEIYERLASGLAVSLGVDALLILRDICGLEQSRIESVMIWSAQTLLKAALNEAAAVGDAPRPST
jgi:AcrR family transcriptional regulator